MRFSFEGWRIGEWFLGNKKTIKELLKVGIPLGIAWVITHNPILTGVATILGKLILDTAEFYIKE